MQDLVEARNLIKSEVAARAVEVGSEEDVQLLKEFLEKDKETLENSERKNYFLQLMVTVWVCPFAASLIIWMP